MVSRFHWTALSVLVGLPLLLFGPGLFQNHLPWFMDTVAWQMPLSLHGAELIRQGELPFWNRTVFAGVPFLANPQLAFFYPPNLLLWLTTAPRVFALLNVLHIQLLGLGVFFWVRQLFPAARLGAVGAGALAQCSGWTFAHLAFSVWLPTCCWIPWMFGFLERHRRRLKENGVYSMRCVTGLIVCAVLSLLGGALQMAFYGQAALWGLGLFRAVGLGRKKALGILALLALQAFFTLALTAPQWMTTRQYIQQCERADRLSLEQVKQGALNLGGIARAWVGGTGRPEDAESILYPGILTLLVALTGGIMLFLKTKKRDRFWILALGALIPLLLSWNLLAPFWHSFLPFYDQFHDPRRVLFLSLLVIFPLAAFGIEVLWQKSAEPGKRGLVVALLLAALVETCLFAFIRIDLKTFPGEQLKQEPLEEVQAGQRVFGWDWGIQYSYNYTRPDFFESFLPNIACLLGLEDLQGYDPLIPWRYALYMRRLNSVPRPAVTLYPSHFGLVRNLDSPWLSRFGPVYVRGPVDYRFPFFPPRWLGPGQSLKIPLQKAWKIPEESQPVQILATYTGDCPSSFALRLDFYHSAGRESAHYQLLSPDAIKGQTPRLWADVLPRFPGERQVHPARSRQAPSPGFSIHGLVAHNVSNQPVLLYSVGLKEKPKDYKKMGPMLWKKVSQNPFSETLALRPVKPPEPCQLEDFETWAMGQSPRRTVIEVPQGEVFPMPLQRISGWRYLQKKANYLDIVLPEGHDGGWVILPEPWFPGWRVSVDGQPGEVYPADVLFRAVPVERGAKRLSMTYFPPGLSAGLAVAGTGFLLLLFMLIRCNRKFSKKQADSGR